MANNSQAALVKFLAGNGGLPKIAVSTRWSEAEIYLHGAHVTRFQVKNEPPLLFLSRSSRFLNGTAIRGGIPIIFPWFGAKEGHAMHGVARTQSWSLQEISTSPAGEVSVRFALPRSVDLAGIGTEYLVSIGRKFQAELIVRNGANEPFTFENCLHTYFQVGDIRNVAVRGLKGAEYLDKPDNFARKTETNEEIRFNGETDRVYLNTEGVVEILDNSFRRKIRVEKSGSRSTVVWNPWISRAQQIPDFGNEEYLQMVCVESGNIAENKLMLLPGESSTLAISLDAVPL